MAGKECPEYEELKERLGQAHGFLHIAEAEASLKELDDEIAALASGITLRKPRGFQSAPAICAA